MKILACIAKLGRNEEGNALIMISLAFWILMAAAGAAIDMSRAQTIRTDLHACLDTAGMAALLKVDETPTDQTATQWVTANVNKYFYTNCLPGNFSGNVHITPVLSNGNNTLTLSLTTRQNTMLMPVIGIKNIPIAVTSVVTRGISGIEMALVLDNTLSMKDPVNKGNSAMRKIDALKCVVAGDSAFGGGSLCENNGMSGQGLLDTIYGGANVLPNVYISVVPFGNMVNLHPNTFPGARFITGGYKGGACVDSRSSQVKSTVDIGLVPPSGRALTLDISEDYVGSASTYFRGLKKEGPDYCPTASPVRQLTDKKSDALATVQQMTNTLGNTMINIGLAWGWRTISPHWQGMWDSTATYTYPNGTTSQLPLPYNTPGVKKIVVLMTDGMNMNGANPARPVLSCCNVNSNTDNAYETQSVLPNNDQLDGMTRDMCDVMKAEGITIYTIGFGIPSPHNPPTVQDRDANPNVYVYPGLLQYCATDASHYFLASTNAALQQAFQKIASSLAPSAIRVAQ